VTSQPSLVLFLSSLDIKISMGDTTTATSAHRKAIIGSRTSSSFWLYDSQIGFDLTHPLTPTSPPSDPRLTLKTTTAPITISPTKSALVIIDMQNFFLSPQLGRPIDSKGLKAQQQLLKYAIPAARKVGIRIIWLNWGLTEEEIEEMPPATLRAFGFETVAKDSPGYDDVESRQEAIDDHGVNQGAEELAKQRDIETFGKDARIYKGLGSEVGQIRLEDGSTIQGGKLLMRDQWNSDVTPPLKAAYEEGLKANPPDVWIHKNRMSGLWGDKTLCTEFLEKEGIKTLLFAGVNTDQCVGGSLQDAFTKGWDCVLLSDGTGTTSPDYSQESIEFNCAKTWGFCMKCEDFAKGVEAM
jgi:nicotinamidase-related amidase